VIAAIVTAMLAAQLAQDPVPSQPAGPPSSGKALTIAGHVVLSGDALPAMDAAEFRPQLMLDARGGWAEERFRYRVQAIFEALLRLRPASAGHVADRGTRVTDAIAAVRDAWIETSGTRAELRAGYGRLIWGRLDEIQPSDVINPLDVSRFLFDGRSEARLPVAFVRGRVFAREDLTIEGVLAPVFERGRFDELDEPSSPFNLFRDVDLPALPGSFDAAGSPTLDVRRVEPDPTWSNMSGGARVSTTIGRVDMAGAVYRGFDTFGLITLEGAAPALTPPVQLTLVERFPRFTMIAGDFETVRGEWALRGEAALFVDRRLADLSRPDGIPGRSVDAGVGFDRRSGDYRLFGSAIVHREWSSDGTDAAKTDVNLVGSIERPLARDRYFLRGFAVVNPADGSAFVRGLFVWKIRDDVSVEGSAAAFLGTSDDMIGRFQDRDFLLARLRYRW
jgi:hypothetical protein